MNRDLNEEVEGVTDIWWESTWRNSKCKGPEAGAIIQWGWNVRSQRERGRR